LQAKKWQVLLDMYVTSEISTLQTAVVEDDSSLNSSATAGLGKKIKEVMTGSYN